MGNNNKPKKLEKKKKPMNPETKRKLVNVFRSIISNQSVIDGAKETPWWVAVIFLVLSICLPVIPITVGQSRAYGSSFVASYNYDSDKGIANTFTTLKTEHYEAKVIGSTLSFYKDGAEYNPDVAGNLVANDMNAYGEYEFLVYFTNKEAEELQAFVNVLVNNKYELNSTTPYNPEKAEQYAADDTKFYSPSFLVLAKNTMAEALYKARSTDRAITTYGGLTWNHSEQGDLIARVTNVDGELQNAAKRKAIHDNWKVILDETYLDQKNSSMLNMSLIYLGVYTGLVLFMGLMIFVLTRGKTSIYRYLNIWVCQKISWWAAFTPAVLGMILGFIMSTNVIGQMAFIVLCSLRIMWMSMRQLRPVQ